MPIKILLVDDEYLALNLLENYIQQLPDLEIVRKVKSPLEALEVLNGQPVDLLFLDIQMPMLSGNNLLKSLPDPPLTIFTTAYDSYALEAFDLNVVDYLLKPFSFERFVQAVQKARPLLQKTANEVPEPISNSDPDFFTIKVDGAIRKVHYDDILYIEGLKEYVRIVCTQERLVTLERLKNLETALPPGRFLRVHKSFIVAVDKVRALEGNQLEIGTQKIPISRNRRDEVVRLIFYDSGPQDR